VRREDADGEPALYLARHGRPGSLVSYNDMGHLPPPLRWTGFPADLQI
jgi:hypothetical protein